MAVNFGFSRHLQLVEEEEDHGGLLTLRRRQRRHRTFWMKPWLQRKSMLGQYETLFQELDRESEGDKAVRRRLCMGFIRMDRNIFAEVLQRVAPRITKSERRPLEPCIKLAITLQYLATGISYKSLEYNFRVPNSTTSLFIPQVCSAIYEEYTEIKYLAYLRPVTNGVHWLKDLGQNGTFITAVELLMENT